MKNKTVDTVRERERERELYFRKIKERKGITLIALVITIIILLILAGITISALTGNGLFEKAKLAKQKYTEAEVKEKIELLLNEYQMEKIDNEELSLYKYFNQKKEEGKIDSLIDNEDGTMRVVLEGYAITLDIEKLNIINMAMPNNIEFSCLIISYENNKFKILVKMIDEINGIDTIEYPNGDVQICNGKKEVAIDYEVEEGKDYIFVTRNLNGIELKKVINLNKSEIPEKPKAPEVTVIKYGGFPVFTETGVSTTGENAIVSIKSSDNNVTKQILYSDNQGSDWKVYKGEIETSSMEILAKSVINVGDGVLIESDEVRTSLLSRIFKF